MLQGPLLRRPLAFRLQLGGEAVGADLRRNLLVLVATCAQTSTGSLAESDDLAVLHEYQSVVRSCRNLQHLGFAELLQRNEEGRWGDAAHLVPQDFPIAPSIETVGSSSAGHCHAVKASQGQLTHPGFIWHGDPPWQRHVHDLAEAQAAVGAEAPKPKGAAYVDSTAVSLPRSDQRDLAAEECFDEDRGELVAVVAQTQATGSITAPHVDLAPRGAAHTAILGAHKHGMPAPCCHVSHQSLSATLHRGHYNALGSEDVA
mmetsp:Transcript_126344/g.299970  ORF Transcript_126344/g.299970 Transcript_126344/m.299970 type:complete len:259 (-) Transcript_126344:157-933(-)